MKLRLTDSNSLYMRNAYSLMKTFLKNMERSHWKRNRLLKLTVMNYPQLINRMEISLSQKEK